MENSEVKRKQPYEKPEILEVVILEDTPQLLAQSGGKNSPSEVGKHWGN